MQKRVIGYIYDRKKPTIEEKTFKKVAKKLGLEIIFFNLSEKIDNKEMIEKAKRCDIIFNDAGEAIATEIVKTFELLGKKVVESSSSNYYPEDKWFFYVECKKNNIPTPKTNLLSTDLNSAKKELEELNSWPIVLKKITGCRGESVDRARDIKEAENVLKKFWKNEEDPSDRIPVIAQEYIISDSYRIMLINEKIVQTVLKRRGGWKASGCHSESFKRFKVSKKLAITSKKIAKMSGIKICGIDYAKRGKEWLVIEVNAEPSLKFFMSEHETLVKKVLEFLIKDSKKK
jgi:glutathione synthase/RimK-type ligase-like ATP-grasp enzyme